MIKLRACPRCHGDVSTNQYGEEECIQCGWVDYGENDLTLHPDAKHKRFLGCGLFPSCDICPFKDCLWEYEPEKKQRIYKKLNRDFRWAGFIGEIRKLLEERIPKMQETIKRLEKENRRLKYDM